MAKVDLTALAEVLGVTSTEAFEQQAANAIASLERLLGYPLCGTTEAEERLFDYTNTLWHRVNPFYEAPAEITLVRGGDEETVTDFQIGQNGKLFGSWFNAFKLCNICNVNLMGRCYHLDQCDYVKVTAKWGFCEPTVEGDDTLCCLPDDLYEVLVAAVKDGSNSKKDIQSESTGTRSYSKFAKSYDSIWVKYTAVIDFYKMREPRIS